MERDNLVVILDAGGNMKKQNSYIFLIHPHKNKKETSKDDGKLVIELGHNVYSFITKTYPSIKRIKDKTDFFKIQCVGTLYDCEVEFVIHEVAGAEYLDISADGKTTIKTICCLERIQCELLGSGIREYYVEIVSYDAISEYYCNKMLVKLNTLERNLRKLLFNIYILNFGKDYYQVTMSSNLQDKIKKMINSTTSKEQKDEIKKAYNVSGKDIESIARLQQFFYSFEFADVQSFLFEPNWTRIDEETRMEFLSKNSDLSQLSDEELRTAFFRLTPKSDWDRFFSSKIHIENINTLIDSIRKYRNSVAHFKHFDRDDYNNCNKIVKKLNNAIVEAIKVTYEVDFTEKNAEIIKNTLSSFQEKIEVLMAPITEMQNNISKSFQPIIDALNRII